MGELDVALRRIAERTDSRAVDLSSLELDADDLTALRGELRQAGITSMNLRGNPLAAASDVLGDLIAITSLDLRGNGLRVLPDWVGNLTALKRLDLSANKLTVLPDWVGNLTVLKSLDLSANKLTVLPSWIGDLTALTYLSLGRNGLTVLPDRIGDLTALTYLSLGGNKLTALPDRIGDLTALTSLDLSGNKLTVLPDRIGDLTALKRLDLRGNKLTVLPDWIGDLSALTSLNLNSSRLSALPDRIGDLTSLTSLSLVGVGLTVLPERIGDLTALISLNLNGNRLSALPDRIGDLTALTSLSLVGAGLTVLPERIGDLSALTSLDLRGNKLTALPGRIGDLIALTTLNLGGAELTMLPDRIGDLSALTRLELNGNELTVLPERIGDLTALTHLDLRRNKLRVLTDRIGDLNALNSIDLSGNQLVALPDRIGDLTELLDLSVIGNPLAPEVLAAASDGPTSLIGFLRLLRTDGIDIAQAKLLLVGEGGAGKTSLLRALRAERFEPRLPQTHGMQIRPVTVTHQGRSIHLNAWDFGGQRHYRPAHQMFFTAPAIYVVVWEPRTGHAQGMVEQWLAMIAHRAGTGAKVFVVATHGGPPTRVDMIDQAALTRRFGDLVVGFHSIDSSQQDARLDALRADIAGAADELPHVRRRYPASWIRTIEQIERTGEQAIPLASYEEIADREGLTPANARSLAMNAHALGTWVYYDDEPALRGLVIVKPDWLSVAIARVLEDPEALDGRGLMTHRRLGQLWSTHDGNADHSYTHAQQQLFLRLMERFELTYRVPDLTEGEPVSLIAQFVPGDRPDLNAAWDDFRRSEAPAVEICQAIERSADRDRIVIPEALIYRLIVRLHHQRLETDKNPQGTHWQGGLLVNSRYGARALITVSGEEVRIAVKGPDPFTYLRQVGDVVRECVAGYWPGLSTRALIPCGHGCGIGQPGRGLFNVDKLVKSLDRGRADVDCQEGDCDARLPIAALLGGRGNSEPTTADVDELALRVEAVERDHALDRQHAVTSADRLGDELTAGLSRVNDSLSSLMRGLDDEAANGPRLFTLVPLDPTLLKPGWAKQRMRLTLYCEHSRLPVGALDTPPSPAGVYDVEVPRDWWEKAAPALRRATALLRPLIGIGLADLELGLGDAQWKAIEEQVALAKESATAALTAAGAASSADDSAGLAERLHDRTDPILADGATLRRLHAMLREQDVGFADLRRVRDIDGRYLWVHRRFVDFYYPPLPRIPPSSF